MTITAILYALNTASVFPITVGFSLKVYLPVTILALISQTNDLNIHFYSPKMVVMTISGTYYPIVKRTHCKFNSIQLNSKFT